jgi:hypothetical protein
MTTTAPKKPKDRLGWLVKQGHVQPEHLDLGERLLKLNEDRQREPSPHMHFDHGAGGGSGGGAILGRQAARQRWERFFAVAGPTGEALVSAIIIDGMSLADAAEYLNINPKAVLPMLRYTLDVLART